MVRRILVFIVSANIVVLQSVILAPGALAATDCVEKGIFLQKGSQNAYGTQGVVYAYNQAVDTSCLNYQGIAQTQIVILSSDRRNWVEVGYNVYRSFSTCAWSHKLFGEWGYAGLPTDKTIYGNIDVGSAPVFKVENADPTHFSWRIWWADHDGGTWHLLDTYYSSMWAQKGWALGEVSKYGAGASANNHEWDLKWLNFSQQWQPWGGINCPGAVGYDTLNSWEWDHFQSDTEFYVVPGNGDC